jgi:carbonic anhydrase
MSGQRDIGIRGIRVRARLCWALTLSLSLAATTAWAATSTHQAGAAVTPAQALDRLMKGNARFVAHKATHPNQGAARLAELAGGQQPIAVILSCSDSRVPPELVFDQGLGDLFVVRVAGEVAADAEIGSIEYAVEHLGASLVVVMGHEKCGAVTAAMSGGESGNHIHAVTDPILPVAAEAKKNPQDPIDAAIRLNVKKVVGELEGSQPLLAAKVKEGSLQVVGAYYSLQSGKVSLLTELHTHAAHTAK